MADLLFVRGSLVTFFFYFNRPGVKCKVMQEDQSFNEYL